MLKEPLVTVCMPAYNNSLYIEDAIVSVISQNYSNIQLIISDDGSTDNTKNIIRLYKEKYPDIIDLQLHPKNLGIALNVDSIYPLIKGEYVCWFAGDDLYLPNKIRTQVELMQANDGCIFSFHDVNVVNSSGNLLYKFNDSILGVKSYKNNIAENLLIHRCYICVNSVMINRRNAKNIIHNIEFGMSADWLLLFELSVVGAVIYIPHAFVAYRRHESNISKSIDITNEKNIYEYVVKNYPDFKSKAYKGLILLYAMYMVKYLVNKDITKSLYCCKYFIINIVRYPLNVFFIIFKICSEINKRVHLLISTGTIIR